MANEESKPKIHLYMDDWRPCPEGFALARTGEECLAMLRECDVDILSLDHEMGPGELSGSEVAARIVLNGTYPNEIYLHTSSEYGRRSMYETLYASKPERVTLHRGAMPEDVRRRVAAQASR
ncbi:cell division protein FtsJ [Saccharibacillus sp. CPCC 101409]|uniref:cyclic-phosphate processing receiver domain-containing protein n=1 Tax=Saccharibacillus sp. CPCC 101409 TaxID=3058041 RepID=UPI0026737AD7|nr:cyclic-phosphate processing receiver domain-containing protein [Saccharibacillus sp. CPCC 101409]MDO3412838.1 cell division protein FtsJ [Saccharibacillus sp. CPCC 101409]